MAKQKYPLIVSSKAMKPCRETRRSLRVAAGTRDHLVDRVEDTLRQMSHSLGTKKERGREGGREVGRSRRVDSQVVSSRGPVDGAHDASDGRSVPLVVTWWCWWWCYGRLCLAFHSRSTNRDERLHARLSAPGHSPACLALSFPFPSSLFPFFSSFPRTSLLSDRESSFLERDSRIIIYDTCVQSSSLVGES